MKRRLSLVVAVPLTIGILAVGGALHTPTIHTFAAASTPPPPPSIVPTTIPPPPPPPASATPVPTATSPPPTAPPPTSTPPAPTKTTAPAKATATAVVQNTAVSHVPTPKATLKPGAGGTYIYSSGSASRLSHASITRSGASVAALPRTGGGSGHNPSSPLAPLALLAAMAIAAGRFIPRLVKR